MVCGKYIYSNIKYAYMNVYALLSPHSPNNDKLFCFKSLVLFFLHHQLREKV